MPEINFYKCTKCDFYLPSGWGGYTYVKDKNGKKIVCPHPGESMTITEVLGLDERDVIGFPWLPVRDNEISKLVSERTGFNSHCVCLDCLAQFDLDVTKEERKCPECNLTVVKTVLEMIGQQCPKCKDGKVEIDDTGIRIMT